MDDDPYIEFDEARDQTMTRATAPNPPTHSSSPTNSPLTGVPIADDRSQAAAIRDALAAKQVCPFCGTQNAVASGGNASTSNGPCSRCTMEDTAATRQATKARIGPWHVLQNRNPAAPGMRYATLLALVGKGQVTARSVVRGPTTHQLWRYAAYVKGLSREFGVCYSCGEAIDKAAANCPHCDRAQEPVGNPDALLEMREATPAPAPAIPSLANEQVTPADAYPIVTRQPATISHAERLRNANAESRRRPDGRALSAMELAAALQVTPPPVPVHQGRPLRTVLITLLIVAVIGSIIVGYARPDIRRQVQNWAEIESSQLHQKLANFHLQKQPPADRPLSSDTDIPSTQTPTVETSTPAAPSLTPPFLTGSQTSGSTIAISPSVVVPPVQSAAPESTAPGSTAPDIAAPRNAAPPDTGTVPTPPITSPLPSVDQTTSASTATPAGQPALVQPDRPVLVVGTPSASEIWVLHSRGLDAESRQDWAEAARCYEQIESAPKELWPGDVKIRLDFARRQLSK